MTGLALCVYVKEWDYVRLSDQKRTTHRRYRQPCPPGGRRHHRREDRCHRRSVCRTGRDRHRRGREDRHPRLYRHPPPCRRGAFPPAFRRAGAQTGPDHDRKRQLRPVYYALQRTVPRGDRGLSDPGHGRAARRRGLQLDAGLSGCRPQAAQPHPYCHACRQRHHPRLCGRLLRADTGRGAAAHGPEPDRTRARCGRSVFPSASATRRTASIRPKG